MLQRSYFLKNITKPIVNKYSIPTSTIKIINNQYIFPTTATTTTATTTSVYNKSPITIVNNNRNRGDDHVVFRNSSLYIKNYYTDSFKQQRNYSTHTQESATQKKITILDLKKKFENNIPITMVTAYDYSSGKEVDKANVDVILVGDSLGMVMLGDKGTTSVTMEQMIHHSKAVMKGVKNAFVVGDMPFGSFESSPRDAVLSAIKLVKETGVDAVKLEGGKKHADKVRAIVEAGIPVMGHIGLTPQSVSQFGGFKLQGKTSKEALQVMEDALALQEAGAFSIVMEMVPDVVASSITKLLRVPTIGIGAGSGTSGQVLVYHDMIGLYSDFVPKFVKQYANISNEIQKALSSYRDEVQSRKFPSPSHSFSMKESELLQYFNQLKVLKNINDKDIQSTLDFQSLNNSNNEILKLTSKQQIKKEEKDKEEKVINPKPNSSNSTKIINGNFEKNSIENASLKIKEEKIKKPKIVVIGSGAMGSFFSAKLAKNDEADVWMVSAWKEHVDNINKKGLTLYDIEGKSENIKSIRATVDAMDVIKDGYPDLALVLVKSHSTKQAALTAATMVGGNPDAVVLTLQNGIGNREEIESSIAEKGYRNRVWQGVTSNGAIVLSPGQVRHTGQGQTYLASPNLKLGKDQQLLQPQTKEEHKALEALNTFLNQAGITTELSYDVDSLVWGKVVVNAAINPLSAVLGVPNGYLVQNEYSKMMMKKIIVEAMGVCAAKGIKLPYGNDSEEGFKYAADVAQRTKTNYSSMLQDVIRGEQTEINSINGVIVMEGERLDIPVSYNKMIMEMVLSCYKKKDQIYK